MANKKTKVVWRKHRISIQRAKRKRKEQLKNKGK